jgi:hypothetical protein
LISASGAAVGCSALGRSRTAVPRAGPLVIVLL